jgi:hypothetical protein
MAVLRASTVRGAFSGLIALKRMAEDVVFFGAFVIPVVNIVAVDVGITHIAISVTVHVRLIRIGHISTVVGAIAHPVSV